MILKIIAAVLSGVAGALGIGGGGILIIYLTLWGNCTQLQAQGINLLFFIPCGVVAVILHAIKGRIDFKTAAFIILGGIPGAVAGFWIGSFIGSDLLGKFFAILLIGLGLKSIFAKDKKHS